MPNIAIYEGGKAARMNGVSRITTDDGNDGKVTWVPQSERQTGTLYVSENGTYRAEDEGLHSWSKVTVRLAGAPLGLEVPTLPDPITGAEIPTGELGELEPVPPAGLEPIDEEVISADEAESINPDATDTDSPNYEDAIQDVADALGVDPDDLKIVDPDDAGTVKDAEPKPKGKGQEITGTNPETGDSETIGINPDGTVEKDSQIVGMYIYSSPTNLLYNNGDSIDFDGLEIALVDRRGNIKKIIEWPSNEIETPETKADALKVEGIEASYDGDVVSLASMIYVDWRGSRRDIFYNFSQPVAITSIDGGSFKCFAASEVRGSLVIGQSVMMRYDIVDGERQYNYEATVGDITIDATGKHNYAGKTAYYGGISRGYTGGTVKIKANGNVNATSGELTQGRMAWIMLYGDYKRGTQTIPVKYGNYEDSFDIWVN